MSASMVSPPTLEKQAESLDILSHFLSISKESVLAAAEESRRQMQLTADEKKRIEEAKAFIAQHASLSADLSRRENELATNAAKHDLDVKQFDTHIASENTRLETFAATLETKQQQQNDTATKQLAEADRLRGLGIDMNRQHQEAMSAVQRQEAANTTNAQMNLQAKAANDTEAARLKEWELKLKAKAQKIRDQAADF